MIESSALFTYNAKYLQTLFGEKWRSFANSLPSMLKLRSTMHEVAWQFNNLAYSFGLMFGRVISTIAFRSLFSLIGGPNTSLFQLDRCQTQMRNLCDRLEQQHILCSLLFVFHQRV